MLHKLTDRAGHVIAFHPADEHGPVSGDDSAVETVEVIKKLRTLGAYIKEWRQAAGSEPFDPYELWWWEAHKSRIAAEEATIEYNELAKRVGRRPYDDEATC